MKENIFTWLLVEFMEAVFAINDFLTGFARSIEFTWGETFIVMPCFLALFVMLDRHIRREVERDARMAVHNKRKKMRKIRKRKAAIREFKKRYYLKSYEKYEKQSDFFFDKAEAAYKKYQQLTREEEGIW